ncbi:uncharacterized protein LOC127747505 [Arachis duranensis]|uniref:Uncharacterized protein LOC127743840 n=1 Tax=Arachis duranensis TaxID=130453 RepID=A0A9C6WIY6_ARADU|nr:uncharacterized protein LOC127743840 [Arachis duranensis]XP_052117437.1 uncharacterized protein LOC127747505 [Arachis duranensis]
MAEFRQYIDESHHDIVNMLTHQMTTILNPILADNESKYDLFVKQVEKIVRIVDYNEGQSIPQDLVVDQENIGYNEENVYNNLERKENIPYLVRRDQNVDEVLNRLHTQRGYHYQVTRIIEDVLNRMGINVSLMYQLYFISAFSSTVQMTEVPMSVKNPKTIIKFTGEAGESTVEHIARYMVELENLTNNENLRMKFFPASLTKNAFTWFSNLRPNLILMWAQLKNTFHAQFYRTELNVSLTYLLAIERDDGESIDDYIIRLKNIRNRCYVSISKSEIVKIAIKGLGLYIR